MSPERHEVSGPSEDKLLTIHDRTCASLARNINEVFDSDDKAGNEFAARWEIIYALLLQWGDRKLMEYVMRPARFENLSKRNLPTRNNTITCAVDSYCSLAPGNLSDNSEM